MRRVLVLNHFASPRSEAGGTRHTELFSRLQDWSHLIVNASTSPGGNVSHDSGSGFLSVWASPFAGNGPGRILNWTTYAISASAKLSLVRRPDVVYASSPHLLAGLAGLLVARRWRVPFLLEIRDLWPKVLVDMNQLAESSSIYQALLRLEWLLYSAADGIVVMAKGTQDDLVERGVPGEKITLIPNGADPSDFDVVEERASLRAEYGFDKTTCVYLGAHGPANGLDLLLDAADVLRGEPVDFVLVGEGVEKARLIEASRTRDLTNVRFMDPIPKTEVARILAASDIGLHILADVPLFRYGISPNKVFDYLAAGLPMVTNVPGEIGDLVLESAGGVVVEPADLDIGIRRLMYTSEEDLKSMGAKGREYMERHQSRTAMAERLQHVLDAAIQ